MNLTVNNMAPEEIFVGEALTVYKSLEAAIKGFDLEPEDYLAVNEDGTSHEIVISLGDKEIVLICSNGSDVLEAFMYDETGEEVPASFDDLDTEGLVVFVLSILAPYLMFEATFTAAFNYADENEDVSDFVNGAITEAKQIMSAAAQTACTPTTRRRLNRVS